MKGAKGYDESIKSEDSSLGFYELFGMKSSYVDVQIAARLARGLIAQIEPRYHDGEITALTMSGVTKEKEEELETLLNQMKIYPWVEEAEDGTYTFSIDNKREVGRFGFFIPLQEQEDSTDNQDQATESLEIEESVPEVVIDEYAFPLPPVPEDTNPKITYSQTPKVQRSTTSDEVPEVDLWMQEAKDNFDQGLPLEHEDETEVIHKKHIDLGLFKKRYRFYKDAIKAPDGTLLSWEDHKEILLDAKNDPEKMKHAVDMSVGLVKVVVDRVLKKFGTNEIFDQDDLFQAGMEGLLYGLQHIEGRDDSKPASYLVPCIEGHVRKVVRTQKRIMSQPHHVADLVSKYRKAQSAVERQNPKFGRLSRREQEEKIAQYAGLSLVEERTVRKMINLKKESFDEENIDPEFSYKEKPLIDTESVEYERVRELFKEALELLEPREELILRLYYGLLGDSRLKGIEDVKDIFSQSETHHVKPRALERLQRLYKFDLAKDDFESLNRAEQMFVALLDKVPESFIVGLHNEDPFKPTDVSLDDIGDIFGISKDRVSQIIAKAMRKLKHPARSKKFRDTGYLTDESRRNRRWGYTSDVTSIDERDRI